MGAKNLCSTRPEAPLCIAIIGSGGKTTLMNRLAQACRGRVLLTATTHLAYPSAWQGKTVHPKQDYPGIFLPFADCASLAADWSALGKETPVLTARLDEEGRHLLGLTPQEVDKLSTLPGLERLIAEADGSKRLPVKAHRSDEPVLFSSCNLGIAVIGLTAVGRRVCAGQVHRPELLRQLLRCTEDHRLTPRDLAAALLAYLEKFSCSRRIAVLSQGEHCPPEYAKETEKALLRLLNDYPGDWARRVLVATAAEFPLSLEDY